MRSRGVVAGRAINAVTGDMKPAAVNLSTSTVAGRSDVHDVPRDTPSINSRTDSSPSLRFFYSLLNRFNPLLNNRSIPISGNSEMRRGMMGARVSPTHGSRNYSTIANKGRMNGEISSSASETMGLSISSSLTAGRAFSMNYTSTRFESSTGGANINNTDGDDENGKTSMDDEYGAMSSSGRTYTHPTPYRLESYGTFGHSTSTLAMSSPRRISPGVLSPANVTYNTYGTLNATRDNVLVICHALTGNASLEAWWGDLLGPGKAFDTDRYYVVCCNILGSCYGSVGPSSLRPGYDHENDGSAAPSTVPRNRLNQAIYGVDFPDVSVRDTVRLQLLLLKNELRISSIKCVIGGSFGGMQAMEYCVMAGATRARDIGDRNAASGFVVGGTGVGGMVVDKDGVVPYMIGEFTTKRNGRIEPFVRSAVPIACGAAHTAWQVGISETQRQAIYADPRWNGGRFDPHDPPNAGLSVARQVAMISYRTPYGYHKKFGRSLTDESGPSYGSKAPWQVKSYLEYQGAKFVERFDPVTYVKLTEQMDSHDVGRGRGSIEQVLSQVEIPVCVLGIDSDVLYPLREQEELARYMPNAELKIIHSDAGHDGFLLEQDQVAAHIKSFLYSHD